MPTKPSDTPQDKPLLHYWGWTPTGMGIRCGAKDGPCTGYAQSTTCPACLDALAQQLAGVIRSD